MTDRCTCHDILIVKNLNRWFKEKWVDVSRKKKDGFPVTIRCWETIYNKFRKGDPIYVEASVKTDRWTDKWTKVTKTSPKDKVNTAATMLAIYNVYSGKAFTPRPTAMATITSIYSGE